MNKKKKVNMHKLYCLLQLVQENLDDLKVTNQKAIRLKNDIAEFCELINNEVANTYTVQKSTYFQNITAKIDTIMRANFNDEM